MSSLQRELLGSIVSVSGEGDRLSGRLRIDDGFIGFKGHFPGMPVLPGVCKIMALAALWQKHTGRAALITEVISAKFITPVLPGQILDFDCRALPGANETELVLKAILTVEGRKVAEVKVRVEAEERAA